MKKLKYTLCAMMIVTIMFLIALYFMLKTLPVLAIYRLYIGVPCLLYAILNFIGVHFIIKYIHQYNIEK